MVGSRTSLTGTSPSRGTPSHNPSPSNFYRVGIYRTKFAWNSMPATPCCPTRRPMISTSCSFRSASILSSNRKLNQSLVAALDQNALPGPSLSHMTPPNNSGYLDPRDWPATDGIMFQYASSGNGLPCQNIITPTGMHNVFFTTQYPATNPSLGRSGRQGNRGSALSPLFAARCGKLPDFCLAHPGQTAAQGCPKGTMPMPCDASGFLEQ